VREATLKACRLMLVMGGLALPALADFEAFVIARACL
jgi:hypothetical protein